MWAITSKMDKRLIKKEFEDNFQSLRKIINHREFIPGSPKDEFDSLNHKILSHLYQNINDSKMTEIITSELTVHYGLTTNTKEIERLTDEIFNW